ncbi:MAG: carbohydrate binding domain-containing protein [Promethearchaeota archaeon]
MSQNETTGENSSSLKAFLPVFSVHICVIIIYLLISCFIFRIPLSAIGFNEYEVYNDLMVPLRLEELISDTYPLWNSNLSSNNFDRITMYPLMLLILFIAQVFQIRPMDLFELLWVFSHTLGSYSMFLSAYLVLRRNFNGNKIHLIIGSFLAGLFFTFNPAWVSMARHTRMKVNLALIPLVFVSFKHGQDDQNLKMIGISSFLWLFIAGEQRWIIYAFLVNLSYTLFIIISDLFLEQGSLRKRNIMRRTALFAFNVILYWLFSLFWIIPYLLYTINTGVLLGPPYILTSVALALYSRNAILTNLLKLNIEWSGIGFLDLPPILQNDIILTFFQIFSVLIFCIWLIPIILNRKNHDVLFFTLSILFWMIIVTALGEDGFPIIKEFMEWVILKFPLGWVFRNPFRLMTIVLLFGSFLIGFTYMELVPVIINYLSSFPAVKNKIKKGWLNQGVTFTVTAVIILSVIIPAWPLLVGDIGQKLLPVEVPDEYFEINEWLSKNYPSSRCLWTPKYMGRKSTWQITGPWDLLNFDEISSYNPTFSAYVNLNKFYTYILDHYDRSTSLILNNRTENLYKFLDMLDVRFLIFHNDLQDPHAGEVEKMLINMQSQRNMSSVKTQGMITIYENEGLRLGSRCYSPEEYGLTFGGQEILGSLVAISAFDPYQTAISFLDYNIREVEDLQKADFIIFPANFTNNDLYAYFGDGYWIFPFDHVTEYDPSSTWSAGMYHDPLYGRWHPYLQDRDIDTYEFDYNKGLIFTYSTKALTEPYDLPAEPLIQIEFKNSSETNFWYSSQDTNLTITEVETSTGVVSCLTGSIPFGDTDRWADFRSAYIEIPDTLHLHAGFSIKGEHCPQIRVRGLYFDEEYDLLATEIIFDTIKPNFDFTQIDETLKLPEKTKFIRFQILSRHNPYLASRWYLDNLYLYSLAEWERVPSIDIPFTIPESGIHEIFIRVFESPEGGQIRVSLDEGTDVIDIDTIYNKPVFRWKHIGNYTFLKGAHKIGFSNTKGFNGISAIKVIPSAKMSSLKKTVSDIISEKDIMYILEAEEGIKTPIRNIENKIPNPSFENSTQGWNFVNEEFSISLDMENSQHGASSLRVSTHNTTPQWSWIISDEIDIEPNSKCIFRVKMKTENSIQSHAVLYGYNETAETWQQIRQNPSGIDGYRDWQDYSINLRLDSDFTKVSVVLNAGWRNSNFPENGTTWFDQIELLFENPDGFITRYGGLASGKGVIYLEPQIEGETTIDVLEEGNYRLFCRFLGNNQPAVSVNINNTVLELSPLKSSDESIVYSSVPIVCKQGEYTIRLNTSLDSYLDCMYLIKGLSDTDPFNRFFESNKLQPKITYEKVSPTKYEVSIQNAIDPFILVLSECYDPLWVAQIDDQPLITSIPCFSIINSFWINKTGDFSITIKYLPQTWFNASINLSVISIAIFWGLIVLDRIDLRKELKNIKKNLKGF